MKKLVYALSFIIFLTTCNNPDPLYNANKIDGLISDLVELKRTVGVTYGIQIEDSISLTKAYGLANLKDSILLHSEHQFRIASVTKPITATAVLQLIEAGELSIEDKINKFFPDFPKGNLITVYQLLSHTSGIPNWWQAGGMPEQTPKDFPMCADPHRYIEKMKKTSLFEPGSFYSYSNTGYVLLGEIIEIVSGMSYESYIDKHIFDPSGMKNTELEHIEMSSSNWVSGYAFNRSSKDPFVEPQYYHMPFAAGGLRSTPQDLLNFMNALFSGRLVSETSLTMMTSYAKLNNGKPVYEGTYSQSGESKQPPGNLKNIGYGLGFQLMENFETFTISHGGDIAGFNAVLLYIPKSETKLVILANTENGILSKLKEIEKAATHIEVNP